MKLSVIIPSFNGVDLLKQSLPPLFDSIRFTRIKEYEVIVVDSGVRPKTPGVSGWSKTPSVSGWSKTPSASRWPKTPGVTRSGSPGVSADKTINLLSKYPHILHLSFPQPLGFAKATNIGIKKAQGEYILLLNNDCLVAKNTLAELIKYLSRNPRILFTQPIVKESGKSVIGYRVDLRIAKAFPVLYDPLSGTSFLPRRQAGDRISGRGSDYLGSGNNHLDKVVQLHNFVNQSNLSSVFNNHSHNNIYGLSATCLLVKKEAFDRIGLFDEAFGSYLEDIDWYLRAVKQNIKFAPCLDTAVTHLHLQTSKRMGSYKAQHDFTNWVRIIVKHYPKKYLIQNLPYLLLERLRNFWGILKSMHS